MDAFETAARAEAERAWFEGPPTLDTIADLGAHIGRVGAYPPRRAGAYRRRTARAGRGRSDPESRLLPIRDPMPVRIRGHLGRARRRRRAR